MNEPELPVRKILFVINPISGKHRQKGIQEVIGKWIDSEKIVHSVAFTEKGGDAVGLTRKAISDGFDAVVAVGGDGTVNEVGQVLVNSPVAMGIIPAGSGNGLARHLKIPFNFKKAIQVINDGRISEIDTATINEKVFLSVAGVGYDAFVAKKFAKAPKRGFISYFRIVSSEYPKYRPRKYEIEIDGKKIVRRAMLLTFANSSQFGNNTSIDPKAMIDDGFIDVCIVRRIPLLVLPLYVPLLFTKTFHRTQYVEIFKAKEVRVVRKKGKTVHFDGDPFKMDRTLEMKINPRSLKIIVPNT